MQIHHASLVDRESPTEPPVLQKLLEGINKSLQIGWVGYETWSHRIIYKKLKLYISTWQHPSVRDLKTSQQNSLKPYPEGIANTPQYEALSNTWGSPKSCKDMFIQNSDGEQRKLPVTKNLALALRHLRSITAPRTLWTDAICINQEDIKERNTQMK